MKKNIAILALMLTIIRITNAQWVDLGVASNHPLDANYPILSIVTDRSGNLYAAGEFHDSTTHFYVVKWTGDTAWAKLGTGTYGLRANGYIYSLATDTLGNLYAAGAFTDQQYQTSGNVYVAKWADTGWVELGANGTAHVPNTAGSAILSIATDPAGNVYAAGEIKDANSTYYVAKWDGTSWTELGTGINALGANGFIHVITTDPFGNVYAAGDFTDAAGAKYVAMWNGTSWSEMGTGSNALGSAGPINAITSDPAGDIYVTYNDTSYQFFVAEWNGTNWTQVGTGSNALNANSSITTLTTDLSGNLYAAGNFTDQDGGQYVAEWNGSTWTELGTGGNSLSPNSYILTIATDTAYNVYAAGYFTDGNEFYYVAEYDPNAQNPTGIVLTPGNSALQLYPNPTDNMIHINTSDPVPDMITIYDLRGQIVQQQPFGTQVDVSGLSSGMYFMQCTSQSSSATVKFTKL